MNETLPGFGRRVGPRAEITYKCLRLWGAYMDEDYKMIGLNFLF